MRSEVLVSENLIQYIVIHTFVGGLAALLVITVSMLTLYAAFSIVGKDLEDFLVFKILQKLLAVAAIPTGLGFLLVCGYFVAHHL
jgi:multisubunit Na+/H+ antiporter MnhB subunit